MGVCHCLQERIEEAASCFKRATEVFPLFTEAHFNLGVCHCRNADMVKAVEAFKNVIHLDGENGTYGRMAKGHLDDFDRISRKSHGIGLQDYLKNQRIFDRAFEALKKRDFQQAIDLFNQVLRIDKNHVQSYGNLGLAYTGIGDKKCASLCFDKALALDPSYEPARVNRLILERAADSRSLLEAIGISEINYYRERFLNEQNAEKMQTARKD